MSVQIDIKPLIMADQPVFQVDGLYGENLRIDQNILGQSQVERCQCLLGIGRDETAAGFLESIFSEYFFVNGDDFVFRAEQSCQSGTGRPQTDDGDIVIKFSFQTNTPFLRASVAQKTGEKRNVRKPSVFCKRIVRNFHFGKD